MNPQLLILGITTIAAMNGCTDKETLEERATRVTKINYEFCIAETAKDFECIEKLYKTDPSFVTDVMGHEVKLNNKELQDLLERGKKKSLENCKENHLSKKRIQEIVNRAKNQELDKKHILTPKEEKFSSKKYNKKEQEEFNQKRIKKYQNMTCQQWKNKDYID